MRDCTRVYDDCGAEPAGEDIDAAFADADVVQYWVNNAVLPTYLRHRQLRPTLMR